MKANHNTKFPVLQVALDFVNLARAIKVAMEAVEGGCDWIEAGTPLIKSEGLNAVRELKKLFPDRMIIADMKIMDAGRVEVESAVKSGADIVTVLAAATDATIRECIEAGKNYGSKIQADLIGVENPISRAKQMEELGVDYIGVHCSIDEQMEGKNKFETLEKIADTVNIPIAIAGGINSETISASVTAGASIIIAGGAITKSKEPKQAVSDLKKAMKEKLVIESKYFKRVGIQDVESILKKVSTANISDAMHRQGDIKGIYPIFHGAKIAGRAVTVRTYPGDWAKTVQAIDQADEGEVIVIDAGGVGPAVWGELATSGAIQKKLAGVVIDGACRDALEIRKMKFPVFAKMITPSAGEPKGLGEINIYINVGGQKVGPGDWIIGDDDGVCVIPASKVVEVTNRAMHVLEEENRLRTEINQGSTLGKVAELLRWEKPK